MSAAAWLAQHAAELTGHQGEARLAAEGPHCQAIEGFLGGGCSSLYVCSVPNKPQAAPGPPAGTEPEEASQAAPPASASSTEANDSEQHPAAGGGEGAAREGAAQPPQLEDAPPAPAPPVEAALRAYVQPPAEHAGRPAVHFMRRGSQLLHTAAEAEAVVTYVALPEGPTVDSLRHVLQHVFSPWIAQQAAGAATPSGHAAAGVGELLLATQKLAGQLEQAARQLGAGVQLPMPEGVDLADPEAAARSEEALSVCERVQEEWGRLISSTLQQEAQRTPQGRGPLAELALWQQRSAAYSALLEQLSLPVVRAVQEVVARGSMDHVLVSSFKSQLSDLTRLALEARDNVKFLLTLERHFKNIAGGSLQSVADTLQPMLNALSQIWVISRYYGDDVRMSNLLERISHGLQDRLFAAIDAATLFNGPSAASIRLVRTCKAIAEGWYNCYMQMREKIEASGHEARWEFSRQLLFESTHYAAEVCGELLGMLEAVDDFCKFLGPELKAVTGDASVVDGVARMVQRMVEPVESVAFNVMDKGHRGEWKAIHIRFLREAEDVKLATRDLIDTCFRKLRSVEAAAHLLQSFKRIQTQGAIQRQMSDKLADVLAHFLKEIEGVRKTFEDSKDSPPLTRNMPPVAGAIRWARGLFGRVKRTMARLQSLEGDLEATEPGMRVAAACKDLARAMLQYEKQCYDTWRATAEHIATSSLAQPVLAREAPPEDGYYGGSTPAPPERLAINFAPALLRLLREAKYLDQLGFAVPGVVVNAALQERRFRQHMEELRAMLEHYYKALDSLHSAERGLLADHLARLEGALSPGLTRLNWNSLAVSDFAAGVDKAVEEFEALVAQVRKNTASLERILRQIAAGPLVPPDPASSPAACAGMSTGGVGSAAGADGAAGGNGAASCANGAGSGSGAASAPQPEMESASAPGARTSESRVPDMQEASEEYEQYRLEAVDRLVERYRAMPPLLLKIEELVVGTSTGKSPKLAGYYAYWERRMFGAIHALVLDGIEAVHSRLKACGSVLEGEAARLPVLQVTLSLIHPEVVLTPSSAEVSKQLGRTLRNLAESSKAFVRWMDGTCLECPEQFVFGEDSEPFVFSFFQDISQSPAVIKAMLGVNHTVQKAATSLNKYVEGWRKHGGIWRADRAALLAKFKARRPSHAAYEQKLAQYSRLAEDVQAMPAACDVEFVRVNCAPLLGALREEAHAWLRGIAGLMREADGPVAQAWEEQAASLQELVQRVPATPEEAERVRAGVEAVLAAAAEAEAACAELEERARTRLLHGPSTDLEGLRAELEAAGMLRACWQQLAAAAAERQQQPIEAPPAAETLPEGGLAATAGGLAADGQQQPQQERSAARSVASSLGGKGGERRPSGQSLQGGRAPSTATLKRTSTASSRDLPSAQPSQHAPLPSVIDSAAPQPTGHSSAGPPSTLRRVSVARSALQGKQPAAAVRSGGGTPTAGAAQRSGGGAPTASTAKSLRATTPTAGAAQRSRTATPTADTAQRSGTTTPTAGTAQRSRAVTPAASVPQPGAQSRAPASGDSGSEESVPGLG